MNDLIDILEQNLTSFEIVELLNNITFNQNDIDKYAIKNMICPKCCSELSIHSWSEPREHFGFPVEEEMNELRCEGCGWVDD